MKKLRRMFCLILCFLMVFQTGMTAYGTELTEPKTAETTESTELETAETKKPETTEPETTETNQEPEMSELETTESTESETTETMEPKKPETTESKEPETTETKKPETTETEEPDSDQETETTEITETTETPESNQKPETTETEEPEEEQETVTVFGISREAAHIAALQNTLAEGFADDSKWTVIKGDNSSGTADIADGKFTVSGGGKCNGAVWNRGKIQADKFLISMDLTLKGATSDAEDIKVAFRSADSGQTGDCIQVRLKLNAKMIQVEKGTNNVGAKNVGNGSPSFTALKTLTQSWSWTQDSTYGLDILVDGDTVTVYIDGTEIGSCTDAQIGAMGRGYFAVVGQFGVQNFEISNLNITTDEQKTGPVYTVTLASATDGKMNDETGGTLTADVKEGYDGDRVKLTPSPKHGYVFDRYESFKEDGTGTDGHLPIADNSFVFSSKTGNVTVVAHFKTRVPGRFELFYDDFGAASLDSAYKTVADSEEAVQEDGILTLNAKSGTTNYLLLNNDKFNGLKPEEGYRISADIWKADTNPGTMQIAFRGADDSPNGRYVLILNGSTALFKYALPDSAAISGELAKTTFTFTTKKVHVELEVVGKTVTFFADGKEILSYTSPDDWPIGSTAGLYNMTPNSKVCFDNFMVERMPEKSAVDVKVLLRENGADVEDTERKGGIAELSAYSAVEGDEITVTATAKAGYRLAECYIEENRQITVTDNKFVIPSGQKGTLTVAVVFESSEPSGARSYYIDSAGGDDANPGTMERPWKSFAPLVGENVVLEPGCGIYLKRGSVFTGQQLAFSGMGSADAPVTVDAYGEGELPRIDGAGAVENVVSLYNQQYITIQNLEITNTTPEFKSVFTLNGNNNTSKNLRAINVSAKDFGVVSGIHIKNCYIHDVNGNNNAKWNGGIFFDVQATVTNMQLSGVPTKYDDVLIEGCTIRNVDRSAIKLVSSAWCNQWIGNDGGKPVNWYPSTNVVVRGNYLEKIGGDGITTRDTDGALIEHNLARDCRYQNTGYNVAIWPFQAANTVIQYNEAYDTHSVQDGQGLDCDHASSYSLMQYNYSHNNEGGFMLIMGGYPHTAPTVRYNVSQNDRDKAFEFAQGLPMGTMIYNNTIYSENPVGKGLFYLSNTSRNQNKGRGVKDFYVFNNLFCYPSSQTTYYGGEPDNIKAVINLYNNGWVGGIQPPTEEANPIVIADTASVLVSAGSAPETNDTSVPRTGSAAELEGYYLAEGAPVIDKGITVEQAIAYFATGDKDGSYDEIFDGRSLSPSKLEEQYQGGWGTTITTDMDLQNRENSIKYVMGTNFPRVSGVRYDLDFFGNRNTEGSAPDIGAAEYLQHTHSGGTATCKQRAVCEICGVEYGKINPDVHSFVDYKSDNNATCTEDGTKTAVCAYGCGATDTKTDVGSAKGHHGGEATCQAKAVCEACGQEYGSKDPTNHTGGTELRNAKEATVTEEGYTGDTYCKGCGAVLSTGTKTDRLPKPGDTEDVESVTLDKTEAIVGKGATLTLTAAINPSNAGDKSLIWVSSDEKVATVDQNGTVTGVKAGRADITVKAANDKSAVCKVTVSSVTLNAKTVPLQVKKSTAALKATVSAKGDSVASWKSSNTKIVKVDSKGKLTATSKTGKATVTVTTKSGAKASCTVQVQKGKVTTKSISLSSKKMTLLKGKSATLAVTRNPISATEKITWTSSNKKVATVSSKGKVTAKKAGTATITAKTSNGKKATCKVTVKNATVKLAKTSGTVKVGKTLQIKIKSTFPKDDKVKSYKSSNKKVATVDKNGKVTGKKKGTANITVTMKSGAKATFKVTVKK